MGKSIKPGFFIDNKGCCKSHPNQGSGLGYIMRVGIYHNITKCYLDVQNISSREEIVEREVFHEILVIVNCLQSRLQS